VRTLRLDLTRPQIIAFRRRVGAIDERLPRGRRSLRRAAWAGLQDSMPRAALLSIHAQVEGTEPSTWEDPSLVQLWGPRYSAYVVAARDLAIFSIGRLPDGAAARKKAEDLAARLHAHLGGGRMTYGEAGHALAVHPNQLRYASPTGTVLIRWDGARLPTVWSEPPPEVDPRDACLELARRYLHNCGPATPQAFAEWAGIGQPRGRAAFDALRRSLTPVRTPVGDAWILTRDEPTFRAALRSVAPAPAERRRLLPPSGRGAPTPCSRRRSPPRALDPARVAGCPPRRGGARRDVAVLARHGDGPDLAASLALGTRCGRGGSGVLASARSPRADRRPLGRLMTPSPCHDVTRVDGADRAGRDKVRLPTVAG
jgi:hypothetical protein